LGISAQGEKVREQKACAHLCLSFPTKYPAWKQLFMKMLEIFVLTSWTWTNVFLQPAIIPVILVNCFYLNPDLLLFLHVGDITSLEWETRILWAKLIQS
jgi:hypothetical protein